MSTNNPLSYVVVYRDVNTPDHQYQNLPSTYHKEFEVEKEAFKFMGYIYHQRHVDDNAKKYSDISLEEWEGGYASGNIIDSQPVEVYLADPLLGIRLGK